METKEKTHENKIRRKLQRMGFMLKKSRRKDPDAYDFGGYMIVDGRTNTIIAGSHPINYNYSLEDVEEWIREKTKG